jgi:hypothetical protein
MTPTAPSSLPPSAKPVASQPFGAFPDKEIALELATSVINTSI